MKISKSEYEWLLGVINTLERENNVLKRVLEKECGHLKEFDEFMNEYSDDGYSTKEQQKEELMEDEI